MVAWIRLRSITRRLRPKEEHDSAGISHHVWSLTRLLRSRVYCVGSVSRCKCEKMKTKKSLFYICFIPLFLLYLLYFRTFWNTREAILKRNHKPSCKMLRMVVCSWMGQITVINLQTLKSLITTLAHCPGGTLNNCHGPDLHYHHFKASKALQLYCTWANKDSAIFFSNNIFLFFYCFSISIQTHV